MNIRLYAAILAGKLSYYATRALGSGGAALPGLVAERIYPTILHDLSLSCTGGIIVICGTNGKTTTSRMVSAALAPEFGGLVHNRSGSNLLRGHISAFLEQCSWNGHLKASVAILETDEAVLPHLLKQVKPRVLLLHNLFRDQLDRYGEVDSIARKWLTAIQNDLPAETLLLINADDPNLAYLGLQANHLRTNYYGMDSPSIATREASSTVDVVLSPVSGKPLKYSAFYLSHLGSYYDPASSFARPTLDLAATHVAALPAEGGSRMTLVQAKTSKSQALELSIPGTYNVYNALAAYYCAIQLTDNVSNISERIGSIDGVFGRFERVEIDNKTFIFCLIKNPVGATEVLRTICQSASKYSLAIFANDNFADGQDVSWYWDTTFETLTEKPTEILCSGLRAHDMALRLKYAGLSVDHVDTATEASFYWLRSKASTPIVYVLSTYTATLDIQKLLTRLGYKKPYWQE